jgi:hypothetical protein
VRANLQISVSQDRIHQSHIAGLDCFQSALQGWFQLCWFLYSLSVAAKGFHQLGVVGAGDVHAVEDA